MPDEVVKLRKTDARRFLGDRATDNRGTLTPPPNEESDQSPSDLSALRRHLAANRGRSWNELVDPERHVEWSSHDASEPLPRKGEYRNEPQSFVVPQLPQRPLPPHRHKPSTPQNAPVKKEKSTTPTQKPNADQIPIASPRISYAPTTSERGAANPDIETRGLISQPHQSQSKKELAPSPVPNTSSNKDLPSFDILDTTGTHYDKDNSYRGWWRDTSGRKRPFGASSDKITALFRILYAFSVEYPEEFHQFIGKHEGVLYPLLNSWGYHGSRATPRGTADDFIVAYRNYFDNLSYINQKTSVRMPAPPSAEALELQMWEAAATDPIAAIYIGVSRLVSQLAGEEYSPGETRDQGIAFSAAASMLSRRRSSKIANPRGGSQTGKPSQASSIAKQKPSKITPQKIDSQRKHPQITDKDRQITDENRGLISAKAPLLEGTRIPLPTQESPTIRQTTSKNDVLASSQRAEAKKLPSTSRQRPINNLSLTPVEPPKVIITNFKLSGDTARTGGIEVIWARRASDGSVAVEIRGKLKQGLRRNDSKTPNFNKRLPPSEKIGLPDYERAHLWGPSFGDEARDGIMYAPETMNKSFQKIVENRLIELREMARNLRGEIQVSARAESYPLTMRHGDKILRKASYSFEWKTHDGKVIPIGQVDISVPPPGSTHHPTVEVTGGSAGLWSLK